MLKSNKHDGKRIQLLLWCVIVQLFMVISSTSSSLIQIVSRDENEVSDSVTSENDYNNNNNGRQNQVDASYKKESNEFLQDVFPPDFKFGIGSSAFQIEGAYQEDGRGESIWDRWANNPENIKDKSNATIACDSYHRYKTDVQLVKSVHADIYRFSISWPRVLPKGTTEIVNKQGLKYYDNLINELISQGIEPMITLFHWDLPQCLQESGGWLNEEVITLFGDYARLIYQAFGEKVKYFITVNEPYTFCYYGYEQGIFPPGLKDDSATAVYDCVHSLIKAHALAYRIYKEEFAIKQNGKVGISLDNVWQEPLDPNSADDIKAAEQSYAFKFLWVAYPLFKGEYPPLMRKIIDAKSKDEKLKESRLPSFEEDWAARVNGSIDFLGINHFTSQLVTFSKETNSTPSWESDSGTIRSYDPNWESTGSNWLFVVPGGMRKSLNKINEDFGNPNVLITENGVSDQSFDLKDSINDNQRVEYHRLYINEVLKAVKIDKCNVTGYIAWNLLDAFQWSEGYREKFGLFHVDHENPNRTRTAKKSVKALQKIFKEKGFPPTKFRASKIVVPEVPIPSKYNVSPLLMYSAPFAVMFSAYYGYTHV